MARKLPWGQSVDTDFRSFVINRLHYDNFCTEIDVEFEDYLLDRVDDDYPNYPEPFDCPKRILEVYDCYEKDIISIIENSLSDAQLKRVKNLNYRQIIILALELCVIEYLEDLNYEFNTRVRAGLVTYCKKVYL